MAKFLNTSRAYAEIEDIVSKAKSNLVLISPYIKIPKNLLERLRYAGNQKVAITLVCRKEDLNPEQREVLAAIENLDLRFMDNLHAKCFYNEESMVITSLNLYESSAQNNREMGIFLTKGDKGVFDEALAEARFIIDSAEYAHPRSIHKSKHVIEEIPPKYAVARKKKEDKATGVCIRCKAEIPLNPDKPYCPNCYEEWAKWKKPDYEDRFCHECGRSYPATMAMPRCDSCYRKSQR